MKFSDLRPPDMVMDIKRLGAMHQTKLSFMRRLIRRMSHEKWSISCVRWELNDQLEGVAVYRVEAKNHVFHQIIFAHQIEDEHRTTASLPINGMRPIGEASIFTNT